MTKEQRTELSRRGGRVAHARGTGRKWTTEEAAAAGAKGAASRKNRAQVTRMEAALAEVEHVNELRCPANLADFDGPVTA